jgi:hypothetical protein
MKIRNGFVSNSSSSSFIIIGKGDHTIPNIIENKLNIPQPFGGNYEFGWEEVEYTDFGDRLNWAALCALYKREQGNLSWLEMLTEVLLEDFPVNSISINFNLHDTDENEDEIWAYIDHQSTPNETPDNGKMFEDKETLRDWLYAKDSYIKNGNDN